MTTGSIIDKVCHTLHDDGVGYGDYLRQIIENIKASLASFRTVSASPGQ